MDSREGDIPDLLGRIRAGDREAAADFVLRYGPALRRRVSGKLGPRMRRLFDSQDILSTVLRRLDVVVERGMIEASSQGQLLALISAIANNAVIERGRMLARLERVEGPDAPIAQEIRARLESAPAASRTENDDLRLADLFNRLESDVDRRILWFWLADYSHAQVAEMLGLTAANVRKRWERIRTRLREAVGEEAAK